MSVSRSGTPANGVPKAVVGVADLMSSFPATWALGGGWAVDAWLGRQTRDHGDADICILLQDQRALFDHLRGWQLLAHDPVFDPESPGDNGAWWDGRRQLNHPCHIHARPPELSGPLPEGGLCWARDGFTTEFYLDLREGDQRILSAEPLITVPLGRAVRTSAWGLPTLVPEVLLFYKATAYFNDEKMRSRRGHDYADFLALSRVLASGQRGWLSDAIAAAHPGHPWLQELTP